MTDTVHDQTNPLLSPFEAPFGVPPFDRIEAGHFMPAFTAAIDSHRIEIEAIATGPQPATFADTIEAMERSGRVLGDVAGVFYNLAGAHTGDALQDVERQIAPVLARHDNAIHLDDRLFRRIDDLYRRKDALGLTAEQARVLDRYHTAFRRKGGGLPQPTKDRLAAIAERLASLGTQFSQNVLADEKAYALILSAGADLAGLPEFLVDAAAEAARERGEPGKYAITLSRSSIEPFLQFSSRRDLRETAYKAWSARGDGGANDNRPIIAEMVRLRAERAQLLGFADFASFRLDDTMAKTPQAARGLLDAVWAPARRRALAEQADMEALVREEGGNFAFAPWDWRHYAEKVRKARFDLDEEALKPYFPLQAMIDAAFYTASRLFGLSFEERTDLALYHPDVRAFEVTRDGRPVGLFLGDYFARPSKRSGAWMSAFRSQEKLAGDIKPIIVNVMNFAKAGEGQPALLSFDDARTLFHEFGHALHGLLSDVTYPRLSGTAVSRDFVEFPSQLFEHWLDEPQILARFARHYRTGEPIPEAMVEKLKASRTFNQGFASVEYTSSALVDLDFHEGPVEENLDAGTVERRTAAAIRQPEAIPMRHRPPHFTHVFSGDGYSAAYYSYLWSEVLDADGFAAFQEAGDIFDPKVAQRLHDYVYAAGNLRDPAEAYRLFRGRMPEPAALLKKRGLDDVAGADA